MTDLKTLKQLVKLMVDNELTELDLEGEGEKIKLKRATEAPNVQFVAPPAAPAPTAAVPTAPSEPAAEAAKAPAGPSIDSPMVGTFYAASSPDEPAFVKVGDKISADTVVCVIEAMKVFNEIKAETSGTIAEVLVENGQPVEFGQPLFRIKP